MSDDKQDPRYRGPARAAPYALSRGSAPVTLVELAEEIQRAGETVQIRAGAKLDAIAEQIRRLQEQARVELEAARRDLDLHRAECRFSRKPGLTYHLYRRPDGRCYFSMLSPAEWGQPPDEHAGSYRLETDMSWTPIDEIEAREQHRREGRRLLALPPGSAGEE